MQESLDLVGNCIREVRTMSYLLHPPVLDDFGLVSALRWYVEGFSQRSGINVRLDLAEEFPRFNRELETTLFRIVQEGLTNVHRHSGGQKACVELKIHERQINTTITDDGHGMSQEALCDVGKGQGGVGLMGMYERVKKLGGTIHIVSTELGTTIKAQLPFMEVRESSAESALVLAGGQPDLCRSPKKVETCPPVETARYALGEPRVSQLHKGAAARAKIKVCNARSSGSPFPFWEH